MRAICVEEEPSVRALLGELPQIEETLGFARAADALAGLDENSAELAVLDIDLPEMNGLEFAAIIKARWPEMSILLVSADSRCALEAFELRVSGFVLKPVTRRRLEREVEYSLRKRKPPAKRRVEVRTFGGFDCFADGRKLSFRQAKCKELLAYLVDRRGSGVTRAEAFSILWEDRLYDRAMQKQLDAIIRSLRATLQSYQIADILEIRSGTMRVRPELLSCDLYRFLSGEPDAVEAYGGEYMSGYAWAELTEAYMARNKGLHRGGAG